MYAYALQLEIGDGEVKPELDDSLANLTVTKYTEH